MSKKNNRKTNDSSKFIQYDPVWIEEYKMMREELVNYMNKLHELKNMMYITVGSVMVFSISDKLPFLCVLLPLLLILPTYKSTINYWLCVRKASAYLVVFHESYEDCPIHWESRHNMFKKLKRKNKNFKKSMINDIPSHLFSYYTCASIIVIVYILKLYKYIIEGIDKQETINIFDICIDDISVLFYIILAIVLPIFLIIYCVTIAIDCNNNLICINNFSICISIY